MKEGILLGLSLAAPIGPVNVEIIRRGIKDWRQGVLTSIGTVASEITRLLIVFVGLYHFLESRGAKFILWLFGFVILTYLGFGAIKEGFGKTKIKLDQEKIKGNSFVVGYLLTISNPLGIVFWVGIYGSLLTSISITERFAGIITGFWILIGIILWLTVFNILIYFGKTIIVKKIFNYISLISGVVLLYFALKFGYQAYFVLTLR